MIKRVAFVLWIIQSCFCMYWINYLDSRLTDSNQLVSNYSDRLDELSAELIIKDKELKRSRYVESLVKELSRP